MTNTTDQDAVHFATNLTTLMSHRGMTQPGLEAASGVPQTTISRMQRNGSPTSQNHYRIAQALRCEMEALYLSPYEFNRLVEKAGKGPITISEKPVQYASEKNGSDDYPESFLLFRSRIHGTIQVLSNGEAVEIDVENPSSGVVPAGKFPGVTAYLIKGDGLTPAVKDGHYVLTRTSGQCAPEQLCLVTLLNGSQLIRELTFEREDSIVFSHPVDSKLRETIPRTTISRLIPIIGTIHRSEFRQIDQ